VHHISQAALAIICALIIIFGAGYSWGPGPWRSPGVAVSPWGGLSAFALVFILLLLWWGGVI
jgi:hypothetical protein